MLYTWSLQNYADAAAHSSRMSFGQMVADRNREPGTPVAWDPLMTMIRGHDIVGFVQFADPATLARTADICISGFAPDVVSVVVDTYTTNVDINPRTGSPWVHEELGEYLLLNPGCNVLLHPPEEQGDEVFVSDALNIIAANRAGDVCIQMLPYRVIGHEVRWNRVTTDTEPTTNSLPDAIRSSMLSPTVEHEISIRGSVPEMFARTMLSPDSEVRRANLDIALAGYLTAHFRMMVHLDVTADTKRGAVFREYPGWSEVGDHLEFGETGNEDGT